MIYIGITPESRQERESDLIAALLDHGLYRLHLRKPSATSEEIEEILRSIPARYYDRIVLHSHFELAERYRLAGIHLNRRFPVYTASSSDYTPALSRSCHTFEEVCEGVGFGYQFLSPIFDSISKSGYSSAFTPERLRQAREQGIINKQVVALGGITPERIAQLREWGFGGAALLGYLWQTPTVKGVITQFEKVKNA